MIALVKESPGPGHVRLTDVGEPLPGRGQVRIAVKIAGVCASDLHILHDDIKLNLRPPVVMGHEFSGCIDELGEGVTGLVPGERVTSETTFRSCRTCRHCRSGNYNLCPEKELIGYVHNGCFAPYVVVPADRVHALPSNLSFEEGAMCEPLACCCHAALEQTSIDSSETVVVAGAGPIGLLCAQLAMVRGAKTILCGTNDDVERFTAAESLGITKLINVSREDAETVVKEATGGEGADVFLECSGAGAAARMGLTLLRRGGRFCQVGLLGDYVNLDFGVIAYKELQVTGSIGSRRSSWEKAVALLANGKVDVKPLLGEPLPLEKWEEAFEIVRRRRALKVLLRPGGKRGQ